MHATGPVDNKISIGQTYGYLTVMSKYTKRSSNGRMRTYCLCKCDCGNEVEVLRDTLCSPGLHSCGCARKEIADKHLARDIIGQKFNRLTVIEEYPECTPREVLCECECGNRIRIKKTEVMSGHTKSCGCLQSERTSESNTKDHTGFVSDYGITLDHQAYQKDRGVWMWDCVCHCGNHFIALPAEVINGHVRSCGCLNESSGEFFIDKYFSENSIKHIPQYSFSDCKDKNKLRFDFAVMNSDDSVKALVEYDGKQHFEPIDWFGGEEEFQKQVKRDKIKNEYCKKNNIPLIRIPYYYTTDEIKQTLANIKLL